MAYRWSQSSSSVTITFNVPPHSKKQDIEVIVTNVTIRAGLRGYPPLVAGQFCGHVKGFKWSLKSNVVSIQLDKAHKAPWADLLVCFA